MNLEKETRLSAWNHVCVWQTRLKAHHCVNRRLIQCVRVAAVHYCSDSSSTSGKVQLLTLDVHKRGRAQSASPQPQPNGLRALNFMTYLRFEITRLASYVCLPCRSHLIPKMPFKMNLCKNILSGNCSEAEEIICVQSPLSTLPCSAFQRL